MDRAWIIRDSSEPLLRSKDKLTQSDSPVSNEKNPAKAYSWSVLFWGAGHLYNNQILKGLSFLFLMGVSYTGIVMTVLFWTEIVSFLQNRGRSVSFFVLIALALLFCALIFGCLCGGDAYRSTASTRKSRFAGSESSFFPFLCSILLPGWGQFLNGQPRKGSVFAALSVVSYFSLIAALVTLLVWKDLEPSSARFLVESIFTIAVLYLPLVLFVWIFSGYDALKVSLEEWKKQPIRERIMAVNYLWRNKIGLRWIFRRIKQALALVLLLIFFLIMLNNHFPRRFYSSELTAAQTWLQSQGMTLLPDLLEKLSLKVDKGAVRMPSHQAR